MEDVPDTRDSLLIRIADPRDQGAWEQFARIYHPVVYNVARMRGLQDADAQDVAQQVLITVARALPTWERRNESTRFRHWLCRIARNATVNMLTRQANVIMIHGVSNDGPLPFLVMPYLRGESLQRRLDRQGPLPPEEIVRIAQQVASGLAAAHGQGLVHRDIKPANILLEDGVERVTLTDFGLARAVDDASMTRSGVIAGTPQYMSPEQAYGEYRRDRSAMQC